MADRDRKGRGQDEFVDGQDPAATDVPAEDPGGGGADPEAEVKRLSLENKRLKKQLDDANKRIQELEAEQAAAARRTKAEQLLKKWEGKGRTFENEELRTAELNRLAGLSDDALSATETGIDSLSTPKKDDPKPPVPPAHDPAKRAEASRTGRLKADAGVEPLVVDDKKPASLQDKLSAGLMASYRESTKQEVA